MLNRYTNIWCEISTQAFDRRLMSQAETCNGTFPFDMLFIVLRFGNVLLRLQRSNAGDEYLGMAWKNNSKRTDNKMSEVENFNELIAFEVFSHTASDVKRI